MPTLSTSIIESLLEHSPFGVMVRDQGRLMWVNRSLQIMVGADVDAFDLASLAVVPGDRLSPLFGTEDTVRISDAAGAPRWLKRMRSSGPPPLRVDYFIEITAEAMRPATDGPPEIKDPETGVLNHHGILAALDKEVSRTRRYGNPLSIIRLQLQAANDSSEIGSAERHSLAQELRAQLRWVDEIGQLDATNLLLVLPETDRAGAERLLGTLQKERIDTAAAQGSGFATTPTLSQWQTGDDRRRLLSRVGWPQSASSP